MILDQVREEATARGRELSGRVAFEARESETRRIWILRPDPGPSLPGLADPFVPPLFVAAMALGEDLHVRAPVSEALLEAATDRLGPRLLAWHDRLAPVRVHAETRVTEAPGAEDAEAASLFSAGVDSWHTLLARHAEIDALVHIHGFEIPVEHHAAWTQVHDHVRRIAADRGLDVLPVRTNALDVALLTVGARLRREGRPWRKFGTDAWYGSMLVGVGLALRPRLARLVVPGSWSQSVDYPVASHPLMEPAWSTASMRFELDGFAVDRVDKVRHLVQNAPEVVPELRVCIDTSGRVRERLNCGRCIKCVRLMMELRVAGCRDADHLFAEPVDLRRAKRRRFHVDPALWGTLEAEAERVGDREVRDAIRVMKDEKFYLPRRWRDLREAIRRRRGASGGS